MYLIQDVSAKKHPFSILQQFGSEKNINDHNFVHVLVSILFFMLLSTKHVNTNAFREREQKDIILIALITRWGVLDVSSSALYRLNCIVNTTKHANPIRMNNFVFLQF